jgi:hypothetical protein
MTGRFLFLIKFKQTQSVFKLFANRLRQTFKSIALFTKML